MNKVTMNNNQIKENLKLHVALKIKYKRLERKLTQTELSNKLNVSRTTVTNIEMGSNWTTLSMLVDLSIALDVTIGFFLPDVKSTIKSEEKQVDYLKYISEDISEGALDSIMEIVNEL